MQQSFAGPFSRTRLIQVKAPSPLGQESRIPVSLTVQSSFSSDLPTRKIGNPTFFSPFPLRVARASHPLRVSTVRKSTYLRCNGGILPDLSFLPASRRTMVSLFLSLTAIAFLAMSLTHPVRPAHARCRNQPGDPGYPTVADWSSLNDTIGGRLVTVVPSVEACRVLGCTEAQWSSGIFRQTIPGAMNAVSNNPT